MSLSQAGNALNASAPFALNWRGLAGYQHNSSSDQAVSSLNSASQQQAMSTDFASDSAQVSLSDAARALAAFDGSGSNTGSTASGASSAASGAASGASGGTDAASDASSASSLGSSDFGQEALYLGGITDASLVAMGIITPDQQAGTQITFNSLSYNVSSSTAAGIGQENGQTVAAYGSQQEAEFVGQGQITTSDGRVFDFQVEVDLDQSQQMEAAGSASTSATGSSQDSSDSAALAADAAPSALPPTQDNPSSSSTSPNAASADSINWDAILNQSKSLIDLLESIGKMNQATQAGSAANSGASAGAASTASGSASGTASAQGASSSGTSGSTSGDSQSPANSNLPVTQGA